MDEPRTMIGVPVALAHRQSEFGPKSGPYLTLARVDNGNRSYEITVPITERAMMDIHRDALTRGGTEDLMDALRTARAENDINLQVRLDAKAPVEVETNFSDKPAARAFPVPTDDLRINGQAVREFFPNAPIHVPPAPPPKKPTPAVPLNRSWLDRMRHRVASFGPRP
ncbi:MAG: hypothetical protein AAGB18_05750 [Pseudomonadota bacterium]